MKKSTLIEITLGTIGGIIFSIGMCMCLIPEWNMLSYGIITSLVGIIILLCIIPVYRKEHPKKKKKKEIDYLKLLSYTIGVVAVLVMGFGMSRIMTIEDSKIDMIIGIVTGVFGLIVCILNYPIYSYIKNNEEKNI